MFKNLRKKKYIRVMMVIVLLSIIGMFLLGYLLNERREFEKIDIDIKRIEKT